MAFFSDFTLRTSGDLAITDYVVGIKGDDSTDDNIKITVDELLAYFQANLTFGGGSGTVDTANSPNAGEFARFTDADTIEGRTAAETRSDLSLVIGTNVQAWSANLDEYAAVNPTAYGLSLVDDANAAATLVTLGITADIAEINFIDGVTSAIQTQLNAKQPLDSDLTTIAGLTATSGNFLQSASSAWASRTPTQATADLIVMTGDAGSGGNKGLVPAQVTGDSAKFLRGDATWQTISGGGDALTTNPLSQFAATTSLQLKGVISDETGSGALVFATSPALTTATITTSLVPTANDGAPLGDATHQFSDLFLAEGGVINWDNGDATITQTGNDITIAGITTFGVGTGTALTAGTIELGAASDTTISRVSAGLIAVEGITLVDLSTAQTLTNKTLTSPVLTTPSAFTTGGTITLAENTSIALDPAGSADGKYTGITVAGIGGATIAFGDLVTLDKDDSRWELVDISVAAAATGDARGIIGIAVTSSTDGGALTVLLSGIIRADAAFPALTIGAPIYASTTGDVVVTQPTTTDHVIRVVGFALTADEMFFNPSNDYTTHT